MSTPRERSIPRGGRSDSSLLRLPPLLKGWGFAEDDSRHEIVNVNGSGISLGHPIGATGIRILADMAHEMHRREVRYGLETMCIGGGQGMAAVFERAA